MCKCENGSDCHYGEDGLEPAEAYFIEGHPIYGKMCLDCINQYNEDIKHMDNEDYDAP